MSLISFFSNKEILDYSSLRTDIHSHYIPGIDDGCNTEEESVALLKRMFEYGFRKIVCTPHVQAEYFRNSREIILPAFDKLQKTAGEEIPGLELVAAAEYLIDDGFAGHIKDGLMFFGEKKYVLVELSYFHPHPTFKNLLQDLLMKGFTPVLAHPERYGYWPVDEPVFEDLHAAGVLFQVNIPSICGYYGSDIRNRAFDLIEKGFVSLAGSDVHNERYASAVIDGLRNKKVREILKSNVFRNADIA